MYTQKEEREYYRQYREQVALKLGITLNQYNWIRRMGERLQSVYVENCNGTISEKLYDIRTSFYENKIEGYIHKLGITYIYYQTDPRGATIYIDTKPIPEHNYTSAFCIY